MRGAIDFTGHGDSTSIGEELPHLEEYLTDIEVAALHSRIDDLLASGRMPSPLGRWPAIPWPAF